MAAADGSDLSFVGDQNHYDLPNANLQLLIHGSFSDCVVKCGRVKFNTHKSILCTRNAYFKAALTRPFKEAATGVVEFDDEYPYAVECLLHWLYTFRWCDRKQIRRADAPSSELEFHIEVYKIADKRQALGLMNMAVWKIEHHLLGLTFDRNNLDDFVAVMPALWAVGGPCENAIKTTMMEVVKLFDSETMQDVNFMAHVESGGTLARALFKHVVSSKDERIASLKQKK